MPKPQTKPAVLRESWRPNNVAQVRALKQQLAVRLTFTALLCCLLAWACYLIFAPLFHPNTRLFFLTAGASPNPGAAPIAYLQDDALRFLTSTGNLSPTSAASHLMFIESPEAFKNGLESVLASVTQASDVAVVYIAARPLLINQQPYLRCDNFEPERPLEGAVACEELFDQLANISTGHIWVLWDIGAPLDQEALVFDDALYFRRLDELANTNPSPRYSILVSHGVEEQSYHSTSLHCSIFALATSLGLSGLADIDGDRRITAEEFLRFTVGTTQSIVQKESGAAASQQPRLLVRPGKAAADWSGLVIGSAPPPSSNKLAAHYGLKLDAAKATPTQLGVATAMAAQLTAQPAEEEEKQTFKSSLNDFVSRKADDIEGDVRNEFNLWMTSLPKPLARGLRRSVSEAEKVVEKPSGQAPESPGETTPSAPPGAEPAPAATGTQERDQPPAAIENSAVTYLAGFPDLGQLADSDTLELLQLAWQVTAYLEQSASDKPRPLDLAPVPWLTWRSHLHAIEQRIRTDAMFDEAQVRLQLTTEILGGYQLAHGKPVTIGHCMREVAHEITPLPLPRDSLDSFGAAKNLKRFGISTLPEPVENAIEEFDQCLLADKPEALDKWLTATATTEVGQLIEVLYSRLLLEEPSIPWSVAQPLLKARRDYELCAHHPLLGHAAVSHSLSVAQRHLLHATRLALDHIGPWEARCTQALNEAQNELANLERRLNIYGEAWQWRNQMLMDVPAMIAWLDIDKQRLGSSNSDQSELGQATRQELPLLLDDLAAIAEACKHRHSTTAETLEGWLRRAQNRHSLIRRSWLAAYEGLQARSRESKTLLSSDAWVIDALLASTLVIGPERAQLLRWRLQAGKLPELTVPASAAAPRLVAGSNSSARARSALLGQLARLGGLTPPDIEEPWAFATVFEQFRTSLASLTASSTSQGLDDRCQALRQADMLQRLSWPSSKLPEDSRRLNRELWRAELASACRLHQQSSAWVLEDALPAELRFWPDLQLRLTQLESALSGQSPSQSQRLPTGHSQITGSGPTRLSLITSAEASGTVLWKNSGPSVGNVWLVADYDHHNLELIADTTLPYYTSQQLPQLLQDALATTEQQLVNLLTNSPADSNSTDQSSQQLRAQLETLGRRQLYPVRPLEGQLTPSAGLAAGQSLAIPFKVRRIGNGLGATKIVWKLISDREYVRCEIPVDRAASQLVRLVSDGPTENWVENSDGLVLHPWPNRETQFRLGLINEGQARTVSVELLRLLERNEIALPGGFVTADVSRQISSRLGNVEALQTLPEAVITESKLPYWLSLPGEKPSAPTKAEDAPPPPSISHGLALVLTDKTTGEKLWRKIDFRIRHPRSYLEPRVRYDATSQRVIIQLRPLPGQLVPASGIQVHGECLTGLPAGSEKRLDGLLAGNDSLELVCEVQPRVGRKVTMALDVDQFPRAFVFDVPCWETQSHVPLVMDQQSLAISAPQTGLLIPGTLDRQLVKLRVDAFPGSFSNQRDVIEVGWDLDRDREFSGESTVKLRSDRNILVDLVGLHADRLAIKAQVKDIEVSIPTPTLRAANVNLLARMHSAGETVWSQAVDVIVDDRAPRITGIELTPDVVIKQGENLTLTMGVDDDNLSGVAAVQLQVDRQLTGQWDNAGATINCERTAQGSWVGALPTADLTAGRTTVLVRATDRANNQSSISKTHFELLSADQWLARQASVGLEITGSISYSGGPLGGARLTMENAQGEVVYQTRANAQGIFQFPKVAAGKYKLVGSGVAKNRPRRSESDLEVKDLSSTPLRLQLQAK